ncbi:hypothetical protein CGRA01v4_14105 [Colletotrichum graminicola]|nr:hypothetical protein CGRA01v4_14105 [Colletotrichum graminicola]
MYHANIFCDAVTTGPRFVCTFQVCCGNISLLSFAVERRFPMEVLEFLLTNTRFRQEDGCRIIDFVEHIGSLIVCLMYGYSGRCFNNSLLDDAKRSLRLLLRAGTQNAFARRIWHNNGQYRTWILSVLHAASVYVSPIPSEPGQPYITRVVPILALLHLVECFMEMFPDEDASFWSVVLQELWMHSRITRGTLRRVADMTLRLLDLGASTTFALPDRAKGGSFLACLENGLEAVEDVNPYVDDIEATIGGTKIMEFGGPGQAIDIIRNRMYGKRIESIERLKKKILGDGSLSPPSVD